MLAFTALLAGRAQAADIEVLTAGAVKPLLQRLAGDFERETGNA
jgi:ABC-type molybdate transport system substrate-binding protein